MTARQAAALAAAATAIAGAITGLVLHRRRSGTAPGKARPERDDVHHPV